MLCLSKTCRICKCSKNAFTPKCNIQDECSNLFFSIFPELVNSKLNNFLKNVCTLCMKQLMMFEKFKNQCIQSDQFFLHYLNQLESHGSTHTELECKLAKKLENYSNDNSQLQSALENNDIQGVINYYNSTVHSSEFDIKHETFISDNEDTVMQQNEGNIDNDSNFVYIKQEILTSDYEESGSQGMDIDSSVNINQDVSSIPDIKEEYYQGKDDPLNIAEDGAPEIDILKHEICIPDKEEPRNESQTISGTKQVYDKSKDAMIQKTCTNNIHGIDYFLHSEVQPESASEEDSTGKKSYECDICKKIFMKKAALIAHRRTHTGERPYMCDICKKSFVQKSHLTVHKTTHSGEKPFECDVCKKRFSRKIVLITHKITHTGEKPYVCDICKKSFSLKIALMRHKRTHTGEMPFA